MSLSLLPLTPAEAVFAPFHDPQIAPTLPFDWQALAGVGCEHDHFWCYTRLHWRQAVRGEPIGALRLPVDVALGRYDELVLCLGMPAGVSVRVEAQIDGQWRSVGDPAEGDGHRMELRGAVSGDRLEALRLTFTGGDAARPGHVALSWFGLADRALRAALRSAAAVKWDPRWPGLVLPEEAWPTVTFRRGLLMDAADLPALRRKAASPTWADHVAELRRRAHRLLDREPEADLGEFLPWSDSRYLRPWELDRRPYFHEPLVLGIVGLIDEDTRLIRHALRYLMCMVHTRHWCASAEMRLVGSTWDRRCFLEEMAVSAVALLWDWFDALLTPRARHLIAQAIWDKGLAVIERDMMKYPYVWRNNQGPWFCRARVLGGLMLATVWPRTDGYADRALAGLQEGLAHYLQPDGGVDEGPGYLSLTLHSTLPALIAAARARGVAPASLLPPQLPQVEQYIRVMSAVEPGRTLPEADQSTDYFVGDTIAMLAALYPGRAFDHIVRPSLLRDRPFTYYHQYLVEGVFGLILGPDAAPEPSTIVPTFAVLPHTGQLTSLRREGERSLRVHLGGAKANPSHSHLDRGNLVVEVDGVLTLIDRGTVRYDDDRSMALKLSRYHNVITVRDEQGVNLDQKVNTEPVIPRGEGDPRTRRAQVDLSNPWREHMTRCERRITSGSVDELTIVDAGELREARRLVFHLHSPFAFEAGDAPGVVLLRGPHATLRIVAPWVEAVHHGPDLIDHRFEPVHHLELSSAVVTGFELTTRIERVG